MSWWTKLRDSAKDSFTSGAEKGILHASGYISNLGIVAPDDYTYDEYGNKIGINKFYAEKISKLYSREGSNPSQPIIGLGSSTNKPFEDKYDTYKKWLHDDGKEANGGPNAKYINTNTRVYQNDEEDKFHLKLPDWGYDDFINERAIWQKGLSSIFDEPAWFYFKVIFDFESSTGLFGDLLNYGNTYKNNSALTYLKSCSQSYYQEKIKHRITALYKFGSLLSYITTNAPWYFKAIKGLDKASVPVISEFSQEKSIELELNSDAIDMRLSTLMSLYQYACFDKNNGKEIIPRNLRMFNMTVILFQTPLRYLHTAYVESKKTVVPGFTPESKLTTFAKEHHLESLKLISNERLESTTLGSTQRKYKRMTDLNNGRTNYSDMMSMKIYTFEGCEFDPSTFAAMIPGSVSNESPFKIGETSIKITYTKCYEHTMNEFYGMMFGTNGFYFNNYATYQGNDNYRAVVEGYWNKQIERYKTLSDIFEDVIGGGVSFGVVQAKTYKKAVDATEAIMNGIINDSDILNKLGTNALMRLLGNKSWNPYATQGNLYGDVGIGSKYYEQKLKQLKNGPKEPKYVSKQHEYNAETDFDVQKYINKFKKTTNVGYDVNYYVEKLKAIKNSPHINTSEEHAYRESEWLSWDDLPQKVKENMLKLKSGLKEHKNTSEPRQYNPQAEFDLRNWINKFSNKTE